MSWLRSTASENKIHELNCCHIYTMILILYVIGALIFIVFEISMELSLDVREKCLEVSRKMHIKKTSESPFSFRCRGL